MCVDTMLMRSVLIWEVLSMKKRSRVFNVFSPNTIILTVLSMVSNVCVIIFTNVINVDKHWKRPSSR